MFMEALELILSYMGKAFSLLDQIPLMAGVSLGALRVFLIILETIIHFAYSHERVEKISAEDREQARKHWGDKM